MTASGQRLYSNIADSMQGVPKDIAARQIALFRRVHPDYAEGGGRRARHAGGGISHVSVRSPRQLIRRRVRGGRQRGRGERPPRPSIGSAAVSTRFRPSRSRGRRPGSGSGSRPRRGPGPCSLRRRGALRAEIDDTVREGLETEGVLRGGTLEIETLVPLGLTPGAEGRCAELAQGRRCALSR